ncbi:hypothetical protein BRCON_2033 [Candidatus Sumerlaea chitinivorans]|uniref:Uncharacterized protein n=1 Tax=Sumerlaea chitinivorans TaxID=2250252 RepID=A0A2Z4Y6H7_SUMC1|nr:hypothetical protein BRCON_2033 [Candidatus Sumerlaea chitinivorans]
MLAKDGSDVRRCCHSCDSSRWRFGRASPRGKPRGDKGHSIKHERSCHLLMAVLQSWWSRRTSSYGVPKPWVGAPPGPRTDNAPSWVSTWRSRAIGHPPHLGLARSPLSIRKSKNPKSRTNSVRFCRAQCLVQARLVGGRGNRDRRGHRGCNVLKSAVWWRRPHPFEERKTVTRF